MEIERTSCAYGGSDSGTKTGRKGCESGTYLVWEDLKVVIPNFGEGPTKKLLKGLHGYAEPGRIMAIMGPSGSGKSTLLDSLAGRLSSKVVMTGNVLFNGKKRKLEDGVAAYVTQEDVLLGTLTARETIRYSAHLRLPASMTKDEIDEVVEGTIIEMGLQECADTVVGNWHLRGLSGGEKKRLSIAQEILTRPSLLFLDEPTSGLDSASAFFVIQTLRSIALDGKTVISSIHQPSSEVFALFDDLFLLSSGETVYFGDAKMAVEFFAEGGFPCPRRRNCSDHFLRCINADFDIVTATLNGSQKICDTKVSVDPYLNMPTAEIKEKLVERYRFSKFSQQAKKRIKEISALEGLDLLRRNASGASWRKQLSVLTKRSFVNMSRDTGYYWSRIVIYILVSICVGTVFFDIGCSYTAILGRAACGAFISGFMTFMSIGGFPSFIEEMKVFHRERLNGYYGVSVFILSNFLSSFPFLSSIALITASICYFMVKFRPGFSHYAFFCLNIYVCISVVESLMMVVAALVSNFLLGILIGAGVIGIMMMTSGFFRLLPDLPKPFWRYPVSYLSYGSWSLQGAYKNDFLGLEFDPLIPGEPKLKGEDIMHNMFGIPTARSKWWDLAACFSLLLTYRILFFVVLKFRERAVPVFQSFYLKKTIKKLDKRPSFRKMASLSSRRHQPPRSLSSQEGLTSPLESPQI